HVDDLADACLFLMQHYDRDEHINVGTGEDLTIRELAELVREVVSFPGEIVYDASKPDGAPRKLLDISRLRGIGWKPRISLREGLERTHAWFLAHVAGDAERHRSATVAARS